MVLELKRIFFKVLFLLLFVTVLSAGVTQQVRPRIYMKYSTRRVPIDITQVEIWVNRQNVTKWAEVSTTEISYLPKEDLAEGEHHVLVVLVDQQGKKKEREWTFKIDPKHTLSELETAWIEPSPSNGDVLSHPEVDFAFEVLKTDVEQLNCEFYLAEGQGGFKKLNINLKKAPGSIYFTLPKMRDGSKTILVKCFLDRGEGSYLQRSILIDTKKPVIQTVDIQPKIWNSKETKQAQVKVLFEDKPFDTLKRLDVRIDGPLGEVLRLYSQNVYQEGLLHIEAGKIAHWPAGFYPLKVIGRDYAGWRAENDFPVYLQIGQDQLLTLDQHFILEPYPLALRSFECDIKGKSFIDTQVALYVRDEFISFVKIKSDGTFRFKKVPLQLGFNTMTLQSYSLDGKALSEKIATAGILVDRSAPRVSELSLGHGERIEDPKPLIKFKCVDSFQTSGSKLSGAGVNESSLQCKVDEQVIEVDRDGEIFVAELKHSLELGVHDLTIKGKDKLGNEMLRRSQFEVVPGPIASMEVSSNKNVLYAWADEFAEIKVILKDRFQRFVRDGTRVYFEAEKGLVSSFAESKEGIVTVKFSPGFELGVIKLKVYDASSKFVKVLKFHVQKSIERIPFRSKVVQSRAILTADRGKSRIHFTAHLYDALGEAVIDGLAIDLSSKLAMVEPSQCKVINGKIEFDLVSSDQVGMDTVLFRHLEFEHAVKVAIKAPPAGPPAKIAYELKPPYLIAGSRLPMRVTVHVVDSYGTPVRDGTGVTFQADRGSLALGGRIVRGKLINNFLAPEESGVAKLKITSGSVSTSFDVQIRKKNEKKKVDKIWHNIPKVWPIARDLKIKGQLLGVRGELITGSVPVFIKSSNGESPFSVLARDGLFETNIKKLELGDLTLELRSEGLSIRHKLNIIDKVEETSSKDEIQELIAILDVEYFRDVLNGDLNMGYLLIRVLELDQNKFDVEQLQGDIVQIQVSEGTVVPRAYLMNGKVKVPFNYKSSKNDIVIDVKLDSYGLTSKLVIPREKLKEEQLSLNHKVDFECELEQGQIIQNKMELSLRNIGHTFPSHFVKFKSWQSSFIGQNQVAWLGDTAKVWYRIPDEGEWDTVEIQCGDVNKKFQLNLKAIRKDRESQEISSVVGRDNSKDREWEFKKGIEVILLSGKTRLQAGGRDRTRLRIRLLDYKKRDLPDGTVVEFIFPQGKLNATRVKSKRGLVTCRLTTADWVGTYPLILRIGTIRKSIPISIFAPVGVTGRLPDFPNGPRNSSKRRKRSF